jgi:hypothetical protein
LRSANRLSERQRLQIANAAQWLCASDRDQFWALVVRELNGARADASVERAIAAAWGAFSRPATREQS